MIDVNLETLSSLGQRVADVFLSPRELLQFGAQADVSAVHLTVQLLSDIDHMSITQSSTYFFPPRSQDCITRIWGSLAS